MIEKTDLQIHSTYSDGSFTPTELFQIAKKQRVKILAITDHDTVAGIPEACQAVKKTNTIFIPGIELTVTYKQDELHILGYGIDAKNPALLKATQFYKKSRIVRIKKMISRLQNLGYQVSFAQIQKRARGSIARPHLADQAIKNQKNQALLKKVFGKIPDRSTFIRKYLIKGKPAYAKKQNLSIREGIRVIHKAGGLAFISHPLGRRYSVDISLGVFSNWRSILAGFKKIGLDGLEVYSSDQFIRDQRNLFQFARKNGFLMSGGSDFHNLEIPGLPLGYITKTRKIPFSVGKNLLKKVHFFGKMV